MQIFFGVVLLLLLLIITFIQWNIFRTLTEDFMERGKKKNCIKNILYTMG